MRVENAAAFSFILQDDIYLLEKDRGQYSVSPQEVTEAVINEPAPVYEEPAKEVEKQPAPVGFKYLGGHKKNFLVIVYYPQHEFMDDKHLAALESTIGRLGFTRDDIAILNRAFYAEITFEAMANYFKPSKLLLLGQNGLPKEMTAIELNKQTTISNFPALYTFSFDEMMDNTEKKKAFWEQMKQL